MLSPNCPTSRSQSPKHSKANLKSSSTYPETLLAPKYFLSKQANATIFNTHFYSKYISLALFSLIRYTSTLSYSYTSSNLPTSRYPCSLEWHNSKSSISQVDSIFLYCYYFISIFLHLNPYKNDLYNFVTFS